MTAWPLGDMPTSFRFIKPYAFVLATPTVVVVPLPAALNQGTRPRRSPSKPEPKLIAIGADVELVVRTIAPTLFL